MAEASYFLGVCERKVECNISIFLVNGHVKPGPVGRSYGSISLAPREELNVFAYQIGKPQFYNCIQRQMKLPLLLILSLLLLLLKRFSNDCRKIKSKAITPTNHNRIKQGHKPITIPSNYL